MLIIIIAYKIIALQKKIIVLQIMIAENYPLSWTLSTIFKNVP